MKGYPLFLVRLDRTPCVVVGGGDVAARKVSGLLEADAHVLVISPELCERLEHLATDEAVEVVRRAYRPGDLEGASLVIAATDEREVNRRACQEAEERGIPVNVVDDPERCSFIAPSVVRRGPLVLAVSTSGRCPALSRHIRQRLEQAFGPAYGDFVDLLGEVRDEALEALPLATRRLFWEEVFESDVLALLARGDDQDARRQVRAIMERYASGEV